MVKGNCAKPEKAYNYFVLDCLKTFLLAFTSLKMLQNCQNDQLLVEQGKGSSKYWPATIRAVVSLKFVLIAKIQDGAFQTISNLVNKINISK